MSRIVSIGTAVPAFGTKQSVILDFMHEAYADQTASRKLNLLFHHSGIETRYSAVPDFAKRKGDLFFAANQSPPMVEARLKVFKEQAPPLALSAITNAVEGLGVSSSDFGFTHLITVTCTGLYAPGLNAELAEHLHLPTDISHTAINFLGCNAAFHALKIGDMIASIHDDAKVLIVCIELCTLHFQPKNNHDNLLSNTIFGDGAAAVIITSNAYAEAHHYPGLSTNGFYSLLLPRGKHLMGWNITSVNFEMILDAQVPEFIGEEIDDLMTKVKKRFNMETDSVHHWAIHPGGKKILDTIKKQLKFPDATLQTSYKVLNDYGNMSSPTILFVLNEILASQLKPGETVFAIGFGPGISIETGLFTYAV
jgi:predicted naringenin-chalcone synthase